MKAKIYTMLAAGARKAGDALQRLAAKLDQRAGGPGPRQP